MPIDRKSSFLGPQTTLMGVKPSSADAPPASTCAPEIEAAARSIVLVVYNTIRRCWLSMSDIRAALSDGYMLVNMALLHHTEMRLTVRRGEILANGEYLAIPPKQLQDFTRHFEQIGINNIQLSVGLEEDEYIRLMDLLCETPDQVRALGGFMETISAGGFPHVKARKVMLQEVSEEETVVEKEKLETLRTYQDGDAEGRILSLLRNEAPAEEVAAATDSLRAVAADSQKMADLVLEAARDLQPVAAADGEAVGRVVTECLERAFNGLLKHPLVKTKKGKKEILKIFKDLKEEMSGRLAGTPGAEGAADAVSGAIDRMADSLKMDAIAADYAKRLKALENSEKRILRFIKSQKLDGETDLEMARRLADSGLALENWDKLIAKSGGTQPGAPDDSAESAMGQLSKLLDQLEEKVEQIEGMAAPSVKDSIALELGEVARELGRSTTQTQAKIQELVRAVHADIRAEEEAGARPEKPAAPQLSRRQMLELLAEIAQEFRQPLSVINCSIDMIAKKMLGAVNEAQSEMLNLALESSQKLETLVVNLESISGVPTTLKPDQDIQRALYE